MKNNTNLTFTHTPNYFFKLFKVLEGFNSYDFTIITFISKFTHTKFKTNNDLITKELGLSRSTVQRSISFLIEKNIIKKTKIYGSSNTNLLTLNNISKWNFENKIQLFEEEIKIYKDLNKIKRLLKSELNMTLTNEDEDYVNTIINIYKDEDEVIDIDSEIEEEIEMNIEIEEEIEPVMETNENETNITLPSEDNYENIKKVIKIINDGGIPLDFLGDDEVVQLIHQIQTIDYMNDEMNQSSFYFAQNVITNQIENERDIQMLEILKTL